MSMYAVDLHELAVSIDRTLVYKIIFTWLDLILTGLLSMPCRSVTAPSP